MKGNFKKVLLAACILTLAMAPELFAMTATQTTDAAALESALGGTGLTIDSVSITNGATGQFGTYTGFTSPPITIGNGLVMSSGLVEQTTAAYHSSGSTPSSNMSVGGTSEFNSYGPGKITNFSGSYDVAALNVQFTLASPSQVGFDFVFGSVEYPVYTNSFTDAFIAFLDGTDPANQIVFDASNNPVQVGTSFASALTTADTNTAFADPHGLVKLQTFTGVLDAGSHSILFEVGDVNDHVLDSAVFISNFHAGEGQQGTTPPTPGVPEPTTMLLLGLGLVGMAGLKRKFKN